MRKTIPVLDGWEIKPMPATASWRETWDDVCATREASGWLDGTIPASVQEILWAHNALDKAVLDTGDATETLWVSELDWVFRRTFRLSETGRVFLSCKGLDAVVDIVLNGRCVRRHLSLYMPAYVEITDDLLEENELLLYFYAPQQVRKWMDARVSPEQRGMLSGGSYYRKTHADFSSHAGVVPYFTPIGVYDDVELIIVPEARLDFVDVNTHFATDYSIAFVNVRTQVTVAKAGTAQQVCAALIDPDGKTVAEAMAGQGDALTLRADNPQLWWPRNYGAQPLYTLSTHLLMEGKIVDSDSRKIGLREIRTAGEMKFVVNGTRVRLWGSCFTPLYGPSHRYIEERSKILFSLLANANINAMRIWGPSQQYNDRLYQEMDRLGVLIWQDFSTAGTHLPEDEDFRQMALAEAEAMIRRLKHHPCILLWCGGNESVYMCELFDKERKIRLGHDLLYYDFQSLANRMDPQRPYRISSPIGGMYANDPRVDSHGSRAALSFLPGEEYGNFFSEDIRTFIPEIKSVKRFLPGALFWDDKWTDRAQHGVHSPLPPSWYARTINHYEEKAGPIEHYYDGTDAKSLIYKFNAAASEDIRALIHKCRRGKSAYNSEGERMATGHLMWKFTTAWPQIYCAFVDYFLEPCQPYYALKRSYSPVLVSIDVGDHVYIWGVNDTRRDFTGRVEISIFDLESNRMFAQRTYAAAVVQGASQIICNLDDIGQFWRTCVVFARLVDMNGEEVCRDFSFIKAERHLNFPDAAISLSQNADGSINIASDTYAHAVALSGDADGEAFGWYFEDNWFDLMPGETRRIQVFGKHSKGRITAKAQYASKESSIAFSR